MASIQFFLIFVLSISSNAGPYGPSIMVNGATSLGKQSFATNNDTTGCDAAFYNPLGINSGLYADHFLTPVHSYLYNITCKKGKYLPNPLVPGQQIPVPDQLDMEVIGEPAKSRTIHAHYCKDLFFPKKWLFRHFDIDYHGPERFGAFLYSQSNFFTKEDGNVSSVVANQKAMVAIWTTVKLYRMTLNRANITLNWNLSTFTQSYEQNSSVYDQFISHYGTHYYQEMIFGGMIKLSFIASKPNSISKLYAEPVQSMMEAVDRFRKEIKMKRDNSHSTRHVVDFEDIGISVYGGNESKMAIDYSKWTESVHTNPKIIGGKLRPISDLISNVTIQTEMRKAITTRLAASYLDQMADTFKKLIFGHNTPNPWNLFGPFNLTNLYTRLRELSKEKFPLQSELQQVGIAAESALQYMQLIKFPLKEVQNPNASYTFPIDM